MSSDQSQVAKIRLPWFRIAAILLLLKNIFLEGIAKVISLSVLGATCATSSLALSVQQNNDALDLVNLLVGPGVSVVGTPSVSGAPIQFGSFTNGSSTVGMDNGVVLSSGNVNSIPGPNGNTDLPETTGSGGAGGDDLSVDIGEGGSPNIPNSFDAATLSFDFQFGDGSSGGQVNFAYSFASEEYVDYVGSVFNDEFQLLIDGVNSGKVNGSDVNINSVNAGQNSAAYINNVANTDGLPNAGLDLKFDGLTTPLIASSGPLSAGVHTATFVVADVSDGILDAGVFIQGGSFSPDVPDVPPTVAPVPLPASMPLILAGIGALAMLRRRR